MMNFVRIIGLVSGLVLVVLGTLLGAVILWSLVRSHVIFIEARLVGLAGAGAILVVGLLLVLLCRKKTVH